jgi:hypothetical protein
MELFVTFVENDLGDITAEHIGACLAENSILEALDIGGNQMNVFFEVFLLEGSTRIGEQGAHYIADALAHNSTLTRLFIDGIQVLHLCFVAI